MEKIYKYSLNDEYIIDEEEQKEIVLWVKENYKKFNNNGHQKYMKSIDELYNVPQVIWKIKKKIIEKENIFDAIQEPLFRDSIGCMFNGGKLHQHIDPNKNGLIHTRFNVYVQLPFEGGYPIYNNKLCKLKERTYICCRAGVDLHECQEVKGDRERIIISYGFLLPPNRIKNVIYEYDN
jgi:hypothetical protein